ncbi:hypothetical protein D3C72_1706840 [compost metagenome]
MPGQQFLHLGAEGAEALEGTAEHQHGLAAVLGVPGESLVMQGPGTEPDDAGRVSQVLRAEVGLVTHGGFSGAGALSCSSAATAP